MQIKPNTQQIFYNFLNTHIIILRHGYSTKQHCIKDLFATDNP